MWSMRMGRLQKCTSSQVVCSGGHTLAYTKYIAAQLRDA